MRTHIAADRYHPHTYTSNIPRRRAENRYYISYFLKEKDGEKLSIRYYDTSKRREEGKIR
jgi:hypothetical protein